ncbi:hypothetical protein PLESTM_000197700 [Pleodorina starrii]|nr:hypothetical protein PLESTM_000197700 [Pleodorina starrii]
MESMTVVQIAAVTMLPIFLRPPESIASGPKGRLQDSAGSAVALALRWLAKIVLLGSIAFLVIGYGDSMPGAVRHYVYSFGLYAFVGFLMDGPAALAVEALGLQVIPTFDQPWMSSCLADFWGRRWNIPTTSVLRTVVYDTIVDGCLVIPARRLAAAPATAAAELKNLPRSAQNGGDHQTHLAPASPPEHQQMQRSPRTPAEQELAARSHPQPKQQQQPMQQGARRPSMLRRQLGLHATFLVSGLVHDYIAWLVRLDGVWGWKWTVFFYMQAPLMSLEALGNRLLRRAGVQLPRPLTILLTLAALEVMAYDLFFGFVERDTDLAHRVVTAVTSSYAGLLAPLQPLVAGLVAAASEESMTVAQIAATLSLPLFPKPLSRTKSGPEGRLQDSAGSGAALAVRLLGKLALTVLVVLLYEQYRETMPLVLKHYVLAFVIYAMSGIIMDGPAAVVVEALGLEVLPTFDQPWMPASGGFHVDGERQQNASAQQQQQQKGIVQQQQKQPRPSLLRRQLGLNAAFFVSGVFHEHMAWLLTGSNKLGWKWTFFFWVQAPLMSLEALGSRLLLRAGVQLPRPLTILLTHVVLQALALDLFFGHMEEQGVSQKIVIAIARCIHAARRPLQSAAVGWLEAAGLLTSS